MAGAERRMLPMRVFSSFNQPLICSGLSLASTVIIVSAKAGVGVINNKQTAVKIQHFILFIAIF
ncbi:MAG: hypothetical protein HC785_30485 [Calothrix sp. CSU_2_0]|nr:hypothetical protein [Calothrix sp. CSU_2_0]